MNVHNCLVDFGVSSNVMPYVVSKRINAEPKKTNTQIIQLDWSGVRVMGELKEVVICHLTPKYSKLLALWY